MADIDFGQLSEALNDKSDRDLRNVDTTAKADAVIDYQEPTSANGYTWYRKYKSGWVEQGGQFTLAYAGTTVTLPIELDNTGYVPTIQHRKTSVPAGFITSVGYMPNTTTITMFGNWSSGAPDNPCAWQISGMAAN